MLQEVSFLSILLPHLLPQLAEVLKVGIKPSIYKSIWSESEVRKKIQPGEP